MSFESLTVKLNDGRTLYFPAGPDVGDNTDRVELLRECIDNGTDFISVDNNGEKHQFNGYDVVNYHLA